MAKRKKKEVIVEVKGLPYSSKLQLVLNIILASMIFVCLLTLVLPIFRFWYPLSSNPTYTNFFVPGYAFIFGGSIKDVASETSTRLLTVRNEIRITLVYSFILVSGVLTGLKYLKEFESVKKILSLFTCLFLTAAFVLIFNYVDKLVDILRGYTNLTSSNTIREGEFTLMGIVMLCFLVVGAVISLYQACCEKIVKK